MCGRSEDGLFAGSSFIFIPAKLTFLKQVFHFFAVSL